MLNNIGMPEILLVLLIVLLVFGAKRLPEMGAAMGKGIREFKRSLKDVQESVDAGNANPPPTRRLDSAPAASEAEPKKLSQ
jgi:sec-independent protein translocase protein TatA